MCPPIILAASATTIDQNFKKMFKCNYIPEPAPQDSTKKVVVNLTIVFKLLIRNLNRI